MIPILLKNESRVATAIVRNERLRRTRGSRIGSSARFSVRRKKIQNTRETKSSPAMCGENQGYWPPANEKPSMSVEEATATNAQPRTSILRFASGLATEGIPHGTSMRHKTKSHYGKPDFFQPWFNKDQVQKCYKKSYKVEDLGEQE